MSPDRLTPGFDFWGPPIPAGMLWTLGRGLPCCLLLYTQLEFLLSLTRLCPDHRAISDREKGGCNQLFCLSDTISGQADLFLGGLLPLSHMLSCLCYYYRTVNTYTYICMYTYIIPYIYTIVYNILYVYGIYYI